MQGALGGHWLDPAGGCPQGPLAGAVKEDFLEASGKTHWMCVWLLTDALRSAMPSGGAAGLSVDAQKRSVVRFPSLPPPAHPQIWCGAHEWLRRPLGTFALYITTACLPLHGLPQFVHSYVDGNLGCFHILAIIIKPL